MKADVFRKLYITCPHCKSRDSGFGVSHLEVGTSFGPWFCDNCGRSIVGVVKDDAVDIELRDERSIPTMDLLVLEPQTAPVYFIVGGRRHEGAHWQRDDTPEDEHKRYYYEEHSCPTNWLEPEAMRFERDNDPHGLIKYVAHIDASALPAESIPHCGRQAWEYFPAFKDALARRGTPLDEEE